jgi:hypothetical protein
MRSRPLTRQPWTQALPWVALVLLVVLALENLAGNPYGLPLAYFVLPVGLALVALVLAVQARRWLDIVVSALVVVAIPLWFLALILMFQFVHLDNRSFSP